MNWYKVSQNHPGEVLAGPFENNEQAEKYIAILVDLLAGPMSYQADPPTGLNLWAENGYVLYSVEEGLDEDSLSAVTDFLEKAKKFTPQEQEKPSQIPPEKKEIEESSVTRINEDLEAVNVEEASETTPTYKIRDRAMGMLEFQIEKLNKRARKNGLPEISLEMSDPYEEDVITKRDQFGIALEKEKQAFYDVKIIGSTPRVDGWTLIGSIQHILQDDGKFGNVVRAAPGFEEKIPKQYWDAKPICDHCKTMRQRNDTFIIQNEDGETKQIGRNCLADFLRTTDPQSIGQSMEMWRIFSDAIGMAESGDEGWYFSSGRQKGVSAYGLMAWTNAIAENVGWVSRTKAREKETWATADMATSFITDPKSLKKENEERRKDGKNEIPGPSNEDFDIAMKAYEWARNLPEEKTSQSDYLMNIKNLANSGQFVSFKSVGYVASIVQAYKRDLEEHGKELLREKQEEERKKKLEEAGESEFVGQVGVPEVIEVNMTTVRGPYFNKKHGSSNLYVGTTPLGKIVKWWGEPDKFTQGESYTILGTPTKQGYDDYQKANVTELERNVEIYKGERSLEEIREEAEETQKNPFIGEFVTDKRTGQEKGKMDNFILTVVDIKGPFDSRFGSSYLYKFEDEQGRKATWFGWNQDLYVGEKYKIRAKPKEHDPSSKYEGGNPVTSLTGLRNVEIIEEEKTSQIKPFNLKKMGYFDADYSPVEIREFPQELVDMGWANSKVVAIWGGIYPDEHENKLEEIYSRGETVKEAIKNLFAELSKYSSKEVQEQAGQTREKIEAQIGPLEMDNDPS